MATAAESKTDVKHVRGILKNTSSFDKGGGSHAERSGCCEKEMKWDEMNILATYHPADKSYGHQKITDPPTPYHHMVEEEKSCDEGESFDSQQLTDGLLKKSRAKIISRSEASEEEEDDDDDDFEHLTPEERAKKLEFSRKRKLHYNEFQAVRLHRQMINDDDDDDDDEGSERGLSAPQVSDITQGGDAKESHSDDTEVLGTVEPME